ncbi:peptidoglycan/xylan/chitin deacetylase (PgdA/CDA1 family) [Kroppenstedtia sanguinis]|uniref:Polysaccharide deacetylase family protein n=1 Tax=Kroppenstedtia sanguinis TaxID=1380684 RepID=A0ABW4C7I7_9BACL
MKRTLLRTGLFLFMAAWVGFSTAWNASYASQAGTRFQPVPEEKSTETVKASSQSESSGKKEGETVREAEKEAPIEKSQQEGQKPPDEEKIAQNREKDPKKEEKKADLPVVVYQGPNKKKRVALTFDDGPDRIYTPQILDILKREKVAATFFVVGKEVNRNGDMAQRIVSEGHVIANHTWNHLQLPRQSDKLVDAELIRTVQAVKKATGKEMSLMRPPYGAVKGKEKRIAQTGHRIINWDVDTNDWRPGRSSQQILATVKEQVVPGSIVLMHSGGGNRSATVQALPQIIRDLKQQGYEFVTVDQLLDIPAYIN